MEAWKQAFVNAIMMAGLSAVPIWMTYKVIDYEMLQAVGGMFLTTFLALMLRYWKPPETDANDDPMEPVVESTGRTPTGKKIVGMVMTNLFI